MDNDSAHPRANNGCRPADDIVKTKNGNGCIFSHDHKGTNGDVLSWKQSNTTAPAGEPASTDPDTECGLWFFRPKWLQPLANKKAFLAVFCLTSVLQGMYYTYFVSVLTTIEKLYQIPSKTTGIIMSATEIGQIGGALLLTYYGGQGHRPKWIACGMVIFAVASILCATPHFIFMDDSIVATRAGANVSGMSRDHRQKLCHIADELLPPVARNYVDVTSDVHPVADALRTVSLCDSSDRSLNQNRITHVVLSVFFISLLFIGIGATAVYTLGIPYIDDNVATRESPLYFGITIGVRIFGPVFGFLLGSYCTSVYVNFPFETSNLSPGNPHWIGAWWLGVFIVGAALIVTAVPMMAFPRVLPHQRYVPRVSSYRVQPPLELHRNGGGCTKRPSQAVQQPLIPSQTPALPSPLSPTRKRRNEKPALRDFPSAIRRLLKNDILLYRTASSVLHILPIAGLYTFLPKYLESQFQQTETNANMIVGFAGILVMGVGIFASGTFMRKFKPNARFVAKWIALSALAYSIGMAILMWVGCPLGDYVGLNAHNKDATYMAASCNSSCECKTGLFSPVCHDRVTYLSPCLAGCAKASGPDEQPNFSDCHCMNANTTITNGFCSLECNNLIWYIIIFSSFVLIHSTSEVGSMLLTLRCVESNDKALALGLIQFAIGLFGNVPCPIIYGAVVDSACLFWEDNCGEPGACRVYDPAKFRMVFHGVTAVIMFIAFLVDAVVWYKASSIHIHEEEDAPAVVTSGAVPESESGV
ncbi:solute carrier organic anion transporter family member 74D-like [Ornithodoros turicata]|uniref:solute carrier organic anion transporter family member 74D-like n=1 Tax=Ornithodoros turicata TaxID=34597 RepID=UPI003138C1DF